MIKKIIFGVVSICSFGFCYYFTDSIKYSLIGTLAVIAYGFWVIRVELGIPLSKEKRAQKSKKIYQDFKEAHDKNCRNNPTI